MEAPFALQRLRSSGPRQGAFTIVIVLIILTLLAVVAVGYLSSMTAERTTAVAFANKAKAEQVAQAAVDSAVATLRQYITVFPDSCTVWDPLQNPTDTALPGTGKKFSEGTSLYYRGMTNLPVEPDPSDPAKDNRPQMLTVSRSAEEAADKRKIYVLPLRSGVIGGLPRPEADKGGALPVLNISEIDANKQNFTDINVARYQGDTQGWVGSPPGYVVNGKEARKPIYVPWVELKDASGSINGRYAFFVEDESFKTNVNYAGLGSASAPHQRRDNDKNPVATDPLGYLNAGDVDLLGPLAALFDAHAADNAKAIADVRSNYPTGLFPEALGFKHALFTDPVDSSATQPKPATLADKLRFLTTTTSGGLNLSRHGSQRLNLNAIIPSATRPTDYKMMQEQLDKVVQTMRFHVPHLGQRFFRSSTAATSDVLNKYDTSLGDGKSTDLKDYSLIYMYKVAANIRDAIDADPMPTYVLQGGGVRKGGKLDAWPDETFWAIGKDSAPYLSEAGVRFTGAVENGRYTLNVDYYVELWNMTAKPVRVADLGPNPVVRIVGPPTWVASNSQDGPPPLRTPKALTLSAVLPFDGGVSVGAGRPNTGRDFTFSIEQAVARDGAVDPREVIFPAGSVTVLTTDAKVNHSRAGRAFSDQDYTIGKGYLQKTAEIQPPITEAGARSHVFAFKWDGSGTSTYTGNMPPPPADPPPYDVIKPQIASATDIETDVIIQSDWGVVDGSAHALPINAIGTNAIHINYTGQGNQPPIFGGYLRGNWTNTPNAAGEGLGASAIGDPRTNNEQLEVNLPSNLPSNAADITRFKDWAVYPRPGPFPPSHPYHGNGVIPTLGLPNYLSVYPNRPDNPWSDYPPLFHSADPKVTPKDVLFTAADLTMSADRAIMVVPDAPFSSIAQLGDVFDPARIVTSNQMTSSRGGGRTLKVGQHDDRWDGRQDSLSRSWTSWRLLDFFCVADAADQPRMLTAYGIEQPGVINVNGVARDNGAALKAALTGFKFQPAPQGDAALALTATPPASEPRLQKMVDQMVTRITSPLTNGDGTPNTGVNQTGIGPFWERGEVSELALFGRTPTPSTPPYTTTDLTGIDMSSKVFDRGREEMFRRLAEMITTRGNVFTVYAVGQSIVQQGTAKRASATQRMKVTFQLIPKMAADATTNISAPFHPGTDDSGKTREFVYFGSDDAGLKKRFAKPDHYDVKILASAVAF